MDEAEVLELVGSHALLASLEPSVLQKVVQGSRIARYRPNRILVRSGDPSDHVLCLLRGAVRVFYREEPDKEILVKLFRAPSLLCEMEVLAEIAVMPNARTLEHSDVLFVPAEMFRYLVRTQRRFADILVLDLSTRLCVASDSQRSLAFGDVDRRFANLILDYAQLAGTEEEGGLRINVALSQEGLARDLCVSRKAINIALGKLKSEGIIAKENGRYVVKDLPRLNARSTRSLGLTHRLGARVDELRHPKAAP